MLLVLASVKKKAKKEVTMSKISVIVPVYNVEKYLSRCIDSILAQTFTDFELILVDDGSTDESGKICDEYAAKDKRIIVIHKENEGVSKARNVALDKARGEYICFCDSDDYLSNDYLDVMYHSMIDTGSDCVSCNGTMVFEKGEEKELKFEAREYVISEWISKYDFIKDCVLKNKIIWAMWARIFKMNIIEEYHIRVCETCEDFAEDLYFFLAYCVHCEKVVHIDFSGYMYFQRESSMMARTSNEIKLNALNEVSYCFFQHIKDISEADKWIRFYPTIHFWIMYNQLKRFWEQAYNGVRDFKTVPTEVNQIVKKKWYKKMITKFIVSRKDRIVMYDKDMTFDYMNLCLYTVHKCYILFSIADRLYYIFKRQ